MGWLEYTILTTTEASDMISNLLIESGSKGVMIEDKNDVALNQRPEGQWDIIDEEIARRIGDDVKVTGYFPVDEFLRDTVSGIESELRRLSSLDLGFPVGKLTSYTNTIDEEDWAESWKKSYKPFRLGKHIVIKPGWESYSPDDGDKIIEIDPGMAFGTGTHETTGMCVELVEEYVKPGMSVIDIGTGTGILAIAAAHMGAKPILATDLDHMAVKVAGENIAINGFSDVITTRCGDLLEVVDSKADIIIANIIADVIKVLTVPVRGLLNDGGIFICSGIARERKDEVLSSLKSAGYSKLDIRDKGEWTAIAASK